GQFFCANVRVGVAAQVRGDRRGGADDVGGAEVGVALQGAGGGQGVGAAGADGRDAVGRLDDVAGAAQEQQVVAVQHEHHGLQAAQVAVHAPVLGQLGGGPRHTALVVLALGLEAVQQGAGLGGSA